MNHAMKIVRLALSAMLASTLVVGCAVGTDSEASVQDEQSEQPGLSTQSGIITETIYYNNAAHTTVVGHCIFQTCIPKGKKCTGQQTPYYETYTDVCY